ncbi:MAG: hypothetical protein P4L42_14875 [Desulfocapsaceae bacterium]|nr:hypothetical protein [Desulfocapsaceae bacterium]
MDENKSQKIPNQKPGVFWISGRIKSTEQVGTDKENFPIIENIIVTPSSDVYSHPKQFCVMARSKFGANGQDITIEVEAQCRPWKDQKGRFHYPHYLWAI